MLAACVDLVGPIEFDASLIDFRPNGTYKTDTNMLNRELDAINDTFYLLNRSPHLLKPYAE